MEWLKSHFGADNVKSATLHLDETTPHIHSMIFPKNEKGRLCAKDWLGGAEKLSAMQDSYALAMQGLELERGKKALKLAIWRLKNGMAKGFKC